MPMSPEVSKKNEFWIPTHRYYELKHFCLQYPYWKTHLKLSSSDSLQSASVIYSVNKRSGHINTVETSAISREQLTKKVETVERACYQADASIAEYILEGVTHGKSYDELNALYSVPCGREYYYKAYRRFFWILDTIRDL